VKVTQETVGDVITLLLDGRHFRQVHTGMFREAITELAAPHVRVVVDLSRLEQVDGPACAASSPAMMSCGAAAAN
jgi:hypothetical protein